MPRTIDRPTTQRRAVRHVSPSVVDPATADPFTLEQELKPFGAWVGKPIWVPPKDSSKTLAETMLRETWPFASQDRRWAAVVKKHRSEFTQVREIDLFRLRFDSRKEDSLSRLLSRNTSTRLPIRYPTACKAAWKSS